MKWLKKIKLSTLLIIVSLFFASCGSNSDSEDSTLNFSDIVGTFEIKNISGNNTHEWLKVGQYLIFNADGTCTTGFGMENSWKNEGGLIKTYYKETCEPMFVYTLKKRNASLYEVQMNGTLDDNTSLKLTLQKVDEAMMTKIFGVWSDGKHFISISSDGYLASYAGYNFIDCGNFTTKGLSLICSNTYFNKQTTYQIKSLADSQIEVAVSYTDVHGNSKTSNLTLSKLDDMPATKDHQLNGKMFSFRSASFGTITYDFSTYNVGKKTSSSANCSKYPLTLFYVFINGKLFFQQFTNKTGQVPTIGGWTSNVNNGDISVFRLGFDASGSVTDFENISNEAL